MKTFPQSTFENCTSIFHLLCWHFQHFRGSWRILLALWLMWPMKIKKPGAAARGGCHSWQCCSPVGMPRGTRWWQHAESLSVRCTTLTLYKSMPSKGLCIYLQDKNIFLAKRICYSPNKTFVEGKQTEAQRRKATHTQEIGQVSLSLQKVWGDLRIYQSTSDNIPHVIRKRKTNTS